METWRWRAAKARLEILANEIGDRLRENPDDIELAFRGYDAAWDEYRVAKDELLRRVIIHQAGYDIDRAIEAWHRLEAA